MDCKVSRGTETAFSQKTDNKVFTSSVSGETDQGSPFSCLCPSLTRGVGVSICQDGYLEQVSYCYVKATTNEQGGIDTSTSFKFWWGTGCLLGGDTGSPIQTLKYVTFDFSIVWGSDTVVHPDFDFYCACYNSGSAQFVKTSSGAKTEITDKYRTPYFYVYINFLPDESTTLDVEQYYTFKLKSMTLGYECV